MFGPLSRLLLYRTLFAQGRLAWRLLLDRRVPLLSKLVPLGTLLYVLSPLDALPDLLLLLGRIDDLTLLLLGLLAFLHLCPQEVVAEHRARLAGARSPWQRPSAGEVVEGRYRVVDRRPDDAHTAGPGNRPSHEPTDGRRPGGGPPSKLAS